MIRLTITAAVAALAANTALAGGIERTPQSITALFERGDYVEFSFATVSPRISGVGAGVVPSAATPTPGISSGVSSPSYSLFGTALKFQLSDKIDTALIFDQPFGADIAYPLTGYYMSGATASLESDAFTGIVKYRFNDRVSAYAGIRAQTMSAMISLPPTLIGPSGYTATSTSDTSLGWLAGIAWEKPEIAARVSLTYNSSIEHSVMTTEDIGLGPTLTTTTVTTPQSVNLEFRTGIAEGTLLFGGVRWVEWSTFDISPPVYVGGVGSPIVAYSNDVFTYSLGVGRQLNENWAIAGSASYEKSNGGFASNLSPTDGKTTVGLGVTYTQDNMKITAGLSHTWIGDANTQLGGSGIAAGNFTGNSATAFGLKVGFNL